jgi:hypothetical protein
MTSATTQDLQRKADLAWTKLGRLLAGMDEHVDTSDTPGEWTLREVLSHLLGADHPSLLDLLRSASRKDYPLVEFQPADTALTPAREAMTLRELVDALDRQRRDLFAYVEGLSESDLADRKVRIPIFKEYMGTDEISLAMLLGAMIDFHWNDHAGQLAKIRRAVGLPEVR